MRAPRLWRPAQGPSNRRAGSAQSRCFVQARRTVRCSEGFAFRIPRLTRYARRTPIRVMSSGVGLAVPSSGWACARRSKRRRLARFRSISSSRASARPTARLRPARGRTRASHPGHRSLTVRRARGTTRQRCKTRRCAPTRPSRRAGL